MGFSKERLAETVSLIDQADMPELLDDIMSGKVSEFGDAGLALIQSIALKAIVLRYEKALSEAIEMIEKQDDLIDKLRSAL